MKIPQNLELVSPAAAFRDSYRGLITEFVGALGLTRVLVTCGKENVASVKAIVRNRGVFDSEEYLPDRGEIVQRYWIDNH